MTIQTQPVGELGEVARGIRLVNVAAYMAWVDRRLSADEVSATRGVATVLGVSDASAGLLSRGPIDPATFEISALEAGARELAYATAVWVALSDGVLETRERRTLDFLAQRLRLDTGRKERIEDLVWMWSGGSDDWAHRYAGVMQGVEGL